MTYDAIYSLFYSKKTDPTFFEQYTETEAYELMRNWLHSIAAIPYVRKCFSSLSLDDEILELTFVLNHSIDEMSDNYFVKDIFAQGMVICWEQQKIDNIVNMAMVIGGKDEKKILDHYKDNTERLNQLNINLRKTIRDYGYAYNTYIEEQ